MKQAVVFALPGTSSEEAAGTLIHMDELFDRRFPGVRRIWAYTSLGVRRKLEQSGKPGADPAEALAGLRDEGVTHVVVKSLHLAAGREYKELRDLVQDSQKGQGVFGRIVLSTPLLDAPADFDRTIRYLLTALPVGTDTGDALLLVAHGSRRREAQAAYAAAATLCRRLDSPRRSLPPLASAKPPAEPGSRLGKAPLRRDDGWRSLGRRVVLGALISHPGLEDVIRECKAAGVERLVLAPLMIVAGISARNEIAGSGPESWISVLRREGICCVPLIKGLGDHDDVVTIWLDDVERMLAELAEPNMMYRNFNTDEPRNTRKQE